MKNFLLCISIIYLLSCEEKKEVNSSEISVIKEKKIEKRKEVVIMVNDSIDSFFTNLFLDEMQDKPDMLFLGQKENNVSVTIPTQNTIKIIGGDPSFSFFYELELKKGDSLLIETEKLNVNQSKQIEYPIFTILNSNKTWSETNFDYLLYKNNIKSKAIVIDENEFQKNKYDSESIYKNSIQLLDSLKSINRISDKFYSTHKINQKLRFATSKLREAKNQNLELEIESLGVQPDDDQLLRNKEYVNFLSTLMSYKYFNEDKRVKSSVLFDFVTDHETFLTPSAKEVLLDYYLKSIFRFEKPTFDKYLLKFNSAVENEELKNEWVSVVDKQKANSRRLNATNRTVGILTNLVNDNELNFEEVLSKHKGKIVLVDFWASWCAPCRKEMPFVKDLKQKFNENELIVIEISIDKDYSAWTRASDLENLSKEEENYIISNWEESSLYKNYKIETIPRYLLFDKKGKIINEDAPKPSEIELEELIRSSL